VLPVNVSYEVTVEITAPAGTEAGLVILGGENSATGLAVRDGKVFLHRRGTPQAPTGYPGNRVFLKLRNVDHDVAFHHSADGRTWSKFEWGASVSTETPLRVALYAAGTGEVVFRHFTYRGLP
jgi:xylan 1,4-beta-xylosidase